MGNSLQQIRKIRGFSQQALATLSGGVLSQGRISAFEQGIAKPDAAEWIVLKNLLGLVWSDPPKHTPLPPTPRKT